MGAEGRRFPACWSGSLGHVPQALIALSISDRTGLTERHYRLSPAAWARHPHKRKSPGECRGLE